MTQAELSNYVALVNMALSLGITTYDSLRAFVRAIAPGKSDDELNGIVNGVRADAQRRKALAEADLAALDTAS